MGRFARWRLAACALALASLLSPSIARAAEEGDPEAVAELAKPPKRRSGILLSLTLGQGLYSMSGYPKDATKIDQPNYYAASGLGLGFQNSLMIMGALSDFANFGFWFGAASYSSPNKDWKATGGGGGFRVDLFPLYKLVPKAQDLGVFGKFGVGFSKLEAQHGASPGAEGAESYVGGGVFYDGWFVKMLGGHLAGGPEVEVSSIHSASAEMHGVSISGRIAFYGGP